MGYLLADALGYSIAIIWMLSGVYVITYNILEIKKRTSQRQKRRFSQPKKAININNK